MAFSDILRFVARSIHSLALRAGSANAPVQRISVSRTRQSRAAGTETWYGDPSYGATSTIRNRHSTIFNPRLTIYLPSGLQIVDFRFQISEVRQVMNHLMTQTALGAETRRTDAHLEIGHSVFDILRFVQSCRKNASVNSLGSKPTFSFKRV